MDKNHFVRAVKACKENGDRLCYDAEACYNSPAGVALAILAQEEFAKAFMLSLVNEGIIPWTPGVKWSIRNHECKHLFILIMDYLASVDEPYSEWMKKVNFYGLTPVAF
jgi:AbiV family abortive infection protein